MEGTIQSYHAILWHGGEPLAEGSLSDCLKSWDALPRWPRTHSYIQLSRPVGQKSVLRAIDLYRIAAGELAQEQH